MPRLPDWFPPYFGISPSVGERYHKDRAKTTLRQDRQGVEDRFETWSAKIFYAELLRQTVQERKVYLRAAEDHEKTKSRLASVMEQLLLQRGVPGSVIRKESRSNNTVQNALFTSQLIKDLDCTSIFLITSDRQLPMSFKARRKRISSFMILMCSSAMS